MTGAVGDLIVQTTTTSGTGTVTLGAAVPPYLTAALAGMRDGDTVEYSIVDGLANSESGFGVLGATQTTLTRNVISSTNSNALISLSGASSVVRITPLRRSLEALNLIVHRDYGGI